MQATTSIESAGQFKRKGVQILGIGKQDLIRFFFGGNAMLSIVVLFLICLFLIREAVTFFPQHHEELELYRETGQEYVGFIIKEMDEYTEFVSLTNQAFYQEQDAAFGKERGLIEGYGIIAGKLEDEGEDLIDELYEAREAVEEAEEPAEKEAAQKELTAAETKWQEFATATIAGVERAQVDPYGRLSDADWAELGEKMKGWDPVEAEPLPFVEEAEAKLGEGMKSFDEARAGIAGAGAELRDLRDELSKVAREVKADAVADQTAEARKAALLEGSENASTEAERQRMREQAEEIVILEQFPFAERTQVFTESKDEHHEAAQALKDQLAPAVAALPTSFASEEAGALIERVRKKLPNFLENLDESVAKASEWSYDEPVSFFGSVLKFFFGKEWITNSSWNDFYGLLPLFSGSLLISIIALAVAVPFSIGAAIYVNRLATPAEQNFIKPAIEMIQAIPSVVLGFFGIAVLGEGMRELSQLEYLSWVPGFPMQERLNILTAGLLLALMAVPTVFTLTEDALNNVPRSFSEASLALGASKLQTILKVVLPSAISGILAAVLLGFGRVIGETMVVLLVAGNQIAIPDFSEGLGVVTQPAHTMTGIIAQEMGEVSDGTLHWRALFLVGLVLFTISLLINITAQQVIKRLSRHS